MSSLFPSEPPAGDEVSQHCVDCRVAAPNTRTEYTLISARFGWRLTPRLLSGGRRVLEWRCPTCWASHKQRELPSTGTRRR